MKNVTIKQEKYNRGRCDCCNKKFTRTIRGLAFGKGSDGIYYYDDNQSLETAKEFNFSNVPNGVELKLVKIGFNCWSKLCEQNDKKISEQKPKKLSDYRIAKIRGGGNINDILKNL